MDPDEFEAYLDTLDPMARRQALYDFGFQKANYVPESFNGAYSPELTQQQYDLGQYGAAPPSLDYEGNVEPWSLDVAKDLENWQQDRADLTADPVMAAMGGGAGGFSPQAFAPIITPVGEPLDLAGSRYVNAMASAGGGYESYLAKKMMQEGMTPGAAVAAMWAAIEAGASPDAPPEVQAEREQLMASLPPNTSTDPALGAPSAQQGAFDFATPEGRNTSTNQGAIFDTANDLFYKMSSDQPVGYTDPATGLQYAGATEEPSELAAHFAELGIPTPFEKYGDPQWLGASLPEGYMEARDQVIGAAKDQVGEAKDVLGSTRQNMQQLRQGWRQSADDRRAATGPVPVTGPADNPYNLSEGSMQAAQTAADLDWEGLQESKEGAPLLTSYLQPGAPADVSSLPTGTPTEGTDADYDAAYDEWATKSQDRLLNEAMQRGAQANRGSPNPYALTSGNDILGTYDFGGMNQHDQGALGSILGLVAQGQGNEDVGFTPYNKRYMQDYGGAVQAAQNQYSDKQNYYDQAYQYQSPEESAYASSLGRAMAMEQMGRTPMEDALMQRSMGQATFNPYAQYGY